MFYEATNVLGSENGNKMLIYDAEKYFDATLCRFSWCSSEKIKKFPKFSARVMHNKNIKFMIPKTTMQQHK